MWAEQHDAVAIAALGIRIVPALMLVEPHQRLDPALAIDVRHLFGEAQMRLDYAAADGLEVEHAGIAGKVFFDPSAAMKLDCAVMRRVDRPVIEGALCAWLAGRVPPPFWFAVEHGDI